MAEHISSFQVPKNAGRKAYNSHRQVPVGTTSCTWCGKEGAPKYDHGCKADKATHERKAWMRGERPYDYDPTVNDPQEAVQQGGPHDH